MASAVISAHALPLSAGASAVGGVPCPADERGGGLSSIAPGASLLAVDAKLFLSAFYRFLRFACWGFARARARGI